MASEFLKFSFNLGNFTWVLKNGQPAQCQSGCSEYAPCPQGFLCLKTKCIQKPLCPRTLPNTNAYMDEDGVDGLVSPLRCPDGQFLDTEVDYSKLKLKYFMKNSLE